MISSSSLVLVTGAAGKTGRAVVGALLAKGFRVRAGIRRAEQFAVLHRLGAQEIKNVEMGDPDSFELLAEGVDAVYHICPNVHPEEVAFGRNAIEAAKSAGVRHFVYHSVLRPQIEAMPHHWLKLRVEEETYASGLPFTILQPCAYMQNTLAQMHNMKSLGIFEVPYPKTTRFSLVDLKDVAAAAGAVILKPEYFFGSYECCGPEVLSPESIAHEYTAAMRKAVTVREISPERWRQNAEFAGLGAYQKEALEKMFRYYRDNHFIGSPASLELLIGGPAKTFTQFLKNHAASLNK